VNPMQKTDSALRETLATTLDHAVSYLESLDSRSVAATADLQELRKHLDKPLTEDGVPAEQVISDLVRDVEGGLLGSAGGRFFGWVVGGSVPAALAADWLTATWDQNAALYATAPAAAVAEEVAGDWLKQIFGLPPQASFALVSGCQMAHVTCLGAARHALLAKQGWDVEERGLYGAPPISIISTAERHGTIERALRLLGMGRGQVLDLPTDAQARLQPEVLEKALGTPAPSTPPIVLLQAGDVNTGSCDPFEELIPLARRYGAWVHVDGAFGLWAAASPRYRHLVKGVESADSWATDGHKWLNVPYDCGYAFVVDSQSHHDCLSHRAAYITHHADARDEMDWNPEWSRRARGFSTYAALRQLGRQGIADLVERCCRHAHAIVMGIGSLPGAEVVWEPTLNQGLVRFLDPKSGATGEDGRRGDDRRTEEVIAAILKSGDAFFGGTTWRGRRAMRVSVCCWQTSEDDVKRVVNSVARVLQPSR
jgi:glutamate/tyrosine decarboxylase-like PLP-dependent enzyme